MFHGTNSGHSKKSSLSKIRLHSHSNSRDEAATPLPPGSSSGSGNSSAPPGNGGQPNALAQQYDRDREQITKSCFSRTDEQGVLTESYITHVRITEDSSHPSSRPPANSSQASKKTRVIIVAVRKSGRVRVHKARENPDSTFQIGKTWNLDELSKIENDLGEPLGFRIYLGKPYYWITNSPREKAVFLNSIVKIYKKYTQGQMPELTGLENIIDPQIRSAPGPSSEHVAFKSSVAQGSIAPVNPRSPPTVQMETFIPPSVPVSKSRSASVSSNHSLPLQIPAKQIPQSKPAPLNAAPLVIPNSHGASVQGPLSAGSSKQMAPTRERSTASISSLNAPSIQARRGPNTVRSPTVNSSEAASTIKPANIIGVGVAAVTTASGIAAVNSKQSTSVSMSRDVRPDHNSHSGFPASATDSMGRTPTSYIDAVSTDQSPVEAVRTRQNLQVQKLPQFRHASEDHEVIEIDSADTTQDSDFNTAQTVVVAYTEAEAELMSTNSDQHIHGHKRTESAISDVKVFARSVTPEVSNKPHTGISFENGPDNPDESRYEKRISNAQNEPVDVVPVMHSVSGGRRTHHRKQSSVSSTNSRRSYGRRKLSFSAMSNASAVEETLAEFNWSGRDDATYLEKSIADELSQIELSHLHSIVDLDEQLDDLDRSLETAIGECDNLHTVLAFFSVQLGGFSDSITHIESQGQGLQVQTTNQKVLWTELRNVLETVSLSDQQVRVLRQEGFDTIQNLEDVEAAVTGLYEALKAVRLRDSDKSSESLGKMRALRERRAMVEQICTEFIDRFRTFCDARFARALTEAEKYVTESVYADDPQVRNIDSKFLEKTYPLSGILLFVKEMDDAAYYSLVKDYQSQVRPYYATAFSAYYSKCRIRFSNLVKHADKFSFVSSKWSAVTPEKSLKRSGTLAKLAADFRDKPSHHVEEDEFLWILPMGVLDGSIGNLREMLEVTTKNIMSQQELLIQFLHMSSYGWSSYASFLRHHPVKSRIRDASMFAVLKTREIDPDRSKAQDLLNTLQSVFANIQENLIQIVDTVCQSTILLAPAFMLLFEKLLVNFRTTNQDFLQQVYQRSYDRLNSVWNSFVNQQVQAVSGTIVSSKKRKGVIFFVKVFPKLCQFLELTISSTLSHDKGNVTYGVQTRKIISESYDKISKAIFHNLQRIAKEPSTISGSNGNSSVLNGIGSNADYEDKEVLNYHILMIENMNVLKDELESSDDFQLRRIMTHSQEEYRKELSLYIKQVLHRPLGKLMDFVDGAEEALNKSPNEALSSRPGFSRSAMKKAMVNYDGKELRKGIETLRRRVEKHFSGSEEEGPITGTSTISSPASYPNSNTNIVLINKVWSALQAETTSLYSRLNRIVEKNYLEPGDTNPIDFTKQDIISAFNRKF